MWVFGSCSITWYTQTRFLNPIPFSKHISVLHSLCPLQPLLLLQSKPLSQPCKFQLQLGALPSSSSFFAVCSKTFLLFAHLSCSLSRGDFTSILLLPNHGLFVMFCSAKASLYPLSFLFSPVPENLCWVLLAFLWDIFSAVCYCILWFLWYIHCLLLSSANPK